MTDTPQTTELPKQYEPQAVQVKWLSFWQQRGYFNAEPSAEKPAHTIVIPLPNVTGALHMGHALNGTLQDLITRWKRMQGCSALWMPGTDHAGIATQAVVERRMLEEEGLTRHDIGREALVNRIWAWKESYEKRILNQLRQLGASCDWRRTRFTLDDVCSKAVRRTFFKLFEDGLIYRGKRLVNWDTFLQTAVADDEVFEEDIDGHFWTFNYPVIGENTIGDDGAVTESLIRFSTTRPETMLGDTAVCVHPSDDRYRDLIGKKVRIPLNGREIPIIADALLADPEKGTGAVKVTPAHDPNDYACGLRNKLPMISILNPNGTLNEAGDNPKYVGKDRYDVRKMVVEDMAELGHFEGVEDRRIPMKHSDRSKTAVEPFLSDQWFVKMDSLAQNAMDAVTDERVNFFPSRYSKTYLDWLSEKRDWCISRQLWWGHRIPIWSMPLGADAVGSDNSAEQLAARCAERLSGFAIRVNDVAVQFEGAHAGVMAGIIADAVEPGEKVLLVCVDEGHSALEQELQSLGFEQDPDVLDTWFSSALWTHATLGWPDVEQDPPLDADEVSAQTAVMSQTKIVQTESNTGANNNAVLDHFYPGSVLMTSRDIITLWVARMVLAGLYNMKDVPFKHVHVHPKILDGFGQTMSKSKGNGVDPMELIEKYGTDAVRFTIASFAGETQDVRLPVGYECPHCSEVIPQTIAHQKATPSGGNKPVVDCPQCKKSSQYSSPWFEVDADEPVARVVSDRFDFGRNFCNKLWNAARFAMLNLEGYAPVTVTDSDLQLEDRWILSRLATVAEQIDDALNRYQFDVATRAIRDFTWNEFCDWYLEMLKPRLRDETAKPIAQAVLVGVLDTLVRLLQPLTPFICEELWERLNAIALVRPFFGGGSSDGSSTSESEKNESEKNAGEMCASLDWQRTAEEAAIIAVWPVIPRGWQNSALEKRFERLQNTIIAVRNVRAVYRIPPSTQLTLHVRCADDVVVDLQNVAGQFDNLAKVDIAMVGPDVLRPNASAGFSLVDADGYIPLEGAIDRDAELDRQQKEAEKLRKHIRGHEGKLSNEKFVGNAPAQVVDDVRSTLADLKGQLESVEQIIHDLSDE